MIKDYVIVKFRKAIKLNSLKTIEYIIAKYLDDIPYITLAVGVKRAVYIHNNDISICLINLFKNDIVLIHDLMRSAISSYNATIVKYLIDNFDIKFNGYIETSIEVVVSALNTKRHLKTFVNTAEADNKLKVLKVLFKHKNFRENILNNLLFLSTPFDACKIIFDNKYYTEINNTDSAKRLLLHYLRLIIIKDDITQFISLINNYSYIIDELKSSYNYLNVACTHDSINIVKYLLEHNLFSTDYNEYKVDFSSFIFTITKGSSNRVLKELIHNKIILINIIFKNFNILTKHIKAILSEELNIKSETDLYNYYLVL